MLKCRSLVRLTPIQGLRQDATQFILNKFKKNSLSFSLEASHHVLAVEKPRDEHPTTPRRSPDDYQTTNWRIPNDHPSLLSVSRIEWIHTVRIFKQKRCRDITWWKFAQWCTFESVRPEGSSLTENGKYLRSPEQQLAHYTVTTPMKTITTSARVEMKTAQNHWKPSTR